MRIQREAASHVKDLCRVFPVVTITGPRQSGKTTLCRELFPDKPYVSLESLDRRAYATNDPRAFLDEYRDGAVIDEVQRVPSLMSYLQTAVDDDPRVGRFILTGSANLSLLESVTQSLAGRTGLVTLLPCTRREIERFPGDPPGLWQQVWSGGFPAIPDRGIAPEDWFAAYVSTYVERDVRQITNVNDLSAFQTFLSLIASRTGQLLNLSQIGDETGITHNTVKAWCSVLEAGYIAFRLQPYHANLRKRPVRTPKLYFYDPGLACFLVGIRTAEQLQNHPLRGALFENYAVCEILKSMLNQGQRPRISFYRDHHGHEVDLLVERGDSIAAVEFKSGMTIAGDFFSSLNKLVEQGLGAAAPPIRPMLIYGGSEAQRRTGARVIPWSGIGNVEW